MKRTIVLIVSFMMLGAAEAQDTTSPRSPVRASDAKASVCHPAPAGKEATQLALQVGICGPVALATGAAVLKKTAPLTAAALANGLGRIGGRAILGLNVAGGVVGAATVMGLLGRGAGSIEKCRVEGDELKKHTIEQVNIRGAQFQKALEDAGFELSAREKRQLQFPAAYLEPKRLRSHFCGEIVLLAEKIKQRQNKVYLNKTEGTMKVVPLPPEPSEKLSRSDRTLMQEFSESLKCLPPEDYILGVCALGNLILFKKALPAQIKVGDARKISSKKVLSAQKGSPANRTSQGASTKTSVQQSVGNPPILAKRQAPVGGDTLGGGPVVRKPGQPQLVGQNKAKSDNLVWDKNPPGAFSVSKPSAVKMLSGRRVSPLEAKLREGRIVSRVKADKGINGAEIVTLDNGMKGVWKAHRPAEDTNYKAEIFAYEIDRKLNFNLVPPTVEYRVGNQVGSLQLYRRGKDAMEKRVADDHQLHKQSLFDYLIDHQDRHRHNYMTSQQNRLISIDNTDSMTEQRGLRGRSYDDRFVEMAMFIRTNEGRAIIETLKKQRSSKLAAEVEGYFGKKDSEAFMKRVDRVIKLANDFQ